MRAARQPRSGGRREGFMIDDLGEPSRELESELSAEDFAEASASRPPAPKRGRFLPNLISNAALFGFNVLVGLWFTPYLIRHLGTASYGIIPLIAQITNYMSVITATINAATGRYITIALERNDDEEANRYFNTSLFGSLLLVLLLLPPAAWAAAHLESLIALPEGREAQTRWLFACTAAGFFLGTLQSPFKVSCFCRNRFDLQNSIDLIQSAARVGLVVVFFSLWMPQLWHVGLATVAAMCLGWGWSIRLWRRLTPTLSVSPAHFCRKALRGLFSTGGWMAVNNLGSILYLNIDLLVINWMFGTESGGRYAAVMQWSVLLRAMAGVVASLFAPTMLYYYARHDIDGLSLYSRRAVKMTGLLMALPIGLICGLSSPLLHTWLGPDFDDLAWLMTLMTIHLSVNLAVTPLFSIQAATNHVRTPALVTLIMGIGNLGLAIILAGPMGWGLYGVAAAGVFALTAKNLVFSPLYAAHILGRRWDAFLWEILPVVLATVLTAAFGKWLAAGWDLAGWLRLGIVAAVISACYAIFAYWMMLNRAERNLAKSLLPPFRLF